VLLARLPDDEARHEADAVLRNIPQELRSAQRGVPADWMADPVRLRRTCEGAARTLTTLPAGTPSLRLLADQTAKVLADISDALNGLALIVVLFWIMTEWPNGALAITFAAIGVLLLAPQADRAYAAAMRFMIGNVLGTVFTRSSHLQCCRGLRPSRPSALPLVFT
jgi:hypothetical protein